jgi:hypothetical protein
MPSMPDPMSGEGRLAEIKERLDGFWPGHTTRQDFAWLIERLTEATRFLESALLDLQEDTEITDWDAVERWLYPLPSEFSEHTCHEMTIPRSAP